MKKNISQRYFTIIGKSLAEISAGESHDIAHNFIPKDDNETVSLITLLSFFDNKEDVDYVVSNFILKSIGNLKPLIRDLLRESRKTQTFPINTISAIIEKYFESLEIVVDILEEIYRDNLFENIITKKNDNQSLILLIERLYSHVNDLTFPLRSLTLSSAQDVFKKRHEDDQWRCIRQAAGGTGKNSYFVTHPIEIILFIKDKKHHGLTFDDILSISDKDILKEDTFLYSVLFVYKKKPYDLLNAKSEWLRNSAIRIISS